MQLLGKHYFDTENEQEQEAVMNEAEDMYAEENLDALTEILFDTAQWPLLSALCTDPAEKN